MTYEELVRDVGWMRRVAELLELAHDAQDETGADQRLCLRSSDVWAPWYWTFEELREDLGSEPPFRAFAIYESTGELCAELLALPPESRRAAIDAGERFHDRNLGVRLLDLEARYVRFSRPQDTVDVAACALRATERAIGLPVELSVDAYSPFTPGDPADSTSCLKSHRYLRAVQALGLSTGDMALLVRAVARVLNSHRVRNQPRLAATFLKLLRDHLIPQVEGAARAEARRFVGKVLVEIELWDDAIGELEASIEEYKELGRGHAAAIAESDLSLVQREAGEPSEIYIESLRTALKNIDIKRDGRLFHLVSLNLPLNLTEAGRLDEAKAAWRAIPPFVEKPLEVRRQGLWGVVNADKEPNERILGVHRNAVAFFRDAGLKYDMALCQLFEARSLLAMGSVRESQAIISEAIDTFISLDLKRYVRASIEALRESLGLEVAILVLSLDEAVSRAGGRGPARLTR